MSADYLPFPAYAPGAFPALDEEPEFDPDRHLALEMPESTVALEALGYDRQTRSRCPSELALTAPCPILSGEGARALRDVGTRLRALGPRTEHNPAAAYIKPRAMVYSSRFVRSLWCCPRLTEFFSDLAGTALAPHSLPSVSATFVYAPEDPRKTNQGWHLDSVSPFSCVISLNDPSSLEGGGFQYYHGTREEVAAALGVAAAELRTTIGKLSDLPPEKVITMAFPRAGAGVLIQGCLVLHRGEPLRARGERMMFVPAYGGLDVGYPDDNNWREIAKWNSPTLRAEYARHKAWRAKQLLERLASEVPIDADPSAFKRTIEEAMGELALAVEELGR